MRKVSERIGDTVNLAREIRAHNTIDFERADYADRMGRVYTIRFRIYNLKFFVKFLNNFLTQMTPFLFFSIGGYLVIQGQLSVGALVAALAAQKDLLSPWNELLNNYQIQQDSQQKYEQNGDRLQRRRPAAQADPAPDKIAPLKGDIVAHDVSVVDEGVTLLERLSFATALEERVAVVGSSGSGKDVLAQLVAGLVRPTSGSLKIASRGNRHPDRRARPPHRLCRRRVEPDVRHGRRQSLLRAEAPPGAAAGLHRKRGAAMALPGRGGDRRQRGAGHPRRLARLRDARRAQCGGLRKKALNALKTADMLDDVYQLGLRVTIDAKAQPDLVQRPLRARMAVRERLAEPENAPLVEPLTRRSSSSTPRWPRTCSSAPPTPRPSTPRTWAATSTCARFCARPS